MIQGAYQRPLEHNATFEPMTEMGACEYSARLGRFLEPDPIDEGSCSAYEYACANPIANVELTGMACSTNA